MIIRALHKPENMSQADYDLLKRMSVTSNEFKYKNFEITLVPERVSNEYSVRIFDANSGSVWWEMLCVSYEHGLVCALRFIETEAIKSQSET